MNTVNYSRCVPDNRHTYYPNDGVRVLGGVCKNVVTKVPYAKVSYGSLVQLASQTSREKDYDQEYISPHIIEYMEKYALKVAKERDILQASNEPSMK